jgi:hypothetical protein
MSAAPGGVEALSRAQARALRRCAPLSSAEFVSRRQVPQVEGLRLGVDQPADQANHIDR